MSELQRRESPEIGALTAARALDAATVDLLRAGRPKNTERAYAASRECWTEFAAGVGREPLPPDPLELARWATLLLTVGCPLVGEDSRRPLAATTVELRLSAVSTWAEERGHAKPNLKAARQVLRGYKREHPALPRQAAAATVPILRALVAQASTQPPLRSARDRTIVLLGFALAARRSELVSVDLEHLRSDKAGMVVSLLRAKVADEAREVPVPYAADAGLCPVRATREYRAALAFRGATSGPLFRQVTRGDRLRSDARLSDAAVAGVVAKLAAAAGVEVPDGFGGWSGHSLRRGFATAAREAGKTTEKIERQGGWAAGSTALGRYLADVDRWEGHPLDGVL